MGVWWRLRQWIYAHPPVAGAGVILLFLTVGLGGWQSARWFPSDGTAQGADTTVYGVKAARTIRIGNKHGRIVTRTRTVTLPGQRHTVVVVKPVTRVVPTTIVRTGGVVTEPRATITQTVTNVHSHTVVTRRTVRRFLDRTVTVTRTQTVVATHTVPQFLDRTVTVTQTQTETGTQIPPGHVRPTVTVTVTQAAVTVTVTTSKGH